MKQENLQYYCKNNVIYKTTLFLQYISIICYLMKGHFCNAKIWQLNKRTLLSHRDRCTVVQYTCYNVKFWELHSFTSTKKQGSRYFIIDSAKFLRKHKIWVAAQVKTISSLTFSNVNTNNQRQSPRFRMLLLGLNSLLP